MDVQYINPFVTATVAVFRSMLGWTIERSGLAIHETLHLHRDLSGIIRLRGDLGVIAILGFDRTVALAATEGMLGVKFAEICKDVTDTLGELTNVVVGKAKADLNGLNLSLGLPTVVIGRDYSFGPRPNVPPISIQFTAPSGLLSVDLGFSKEIRSARSRHSAAPAGISSRS
jgi:chemotaxis protein CheX